MNMLQQAQQSYLNPEHLKKLIRSSDATKRLKGYRELGDGVYWRNALNDSSSMIREEAKNFLRRAI